MPGLPAVSGYIHRLSLETQGAPSDSLNPTDLADYMYAADPKEEEALLKRHLTMSQAENKSKKSESSAIQF
jgi:hypothetical protein